MTDVDGRRKKIYFFAMVLSHSRFKFVCFNEHPYTTETAIAAHEAAFAFIGGYPGEFFYDQEKALGYLENIHKQMPRYARDQIRMVSSAGKNIQHRRCTRPWPTVLKITCPGGC
jgi:transposase